MKTKILIYFSALLFLSSCSKDKEILNYKGQFTITGQVVDASTGMGIPFARVQVSELPRGFWASGGKWVIDLKADANGIYSFSFQANAEDNYYQLYARSDNYEDMQGGEEITFTRNKKKTQNITLVPFAYFKLHVVGNSGGQNIAFRFTKFNEGVDTTMLFYRNPLSESSLTYSVHFRDTAFNYKKSLVIHPALSTDTPYYKIEF
ncbi:MAG: carboxypeptidase regulatory-like domain-containing protein [Bacteroidetes bacterium]|nr:MAG: carboxypeptidase regulatory-like domain-containing protein [Bacteroidota bacterium]